MEVDQDDEVDLDEQNEDQAWDEGFVRLSGGCRWRHAPFCVEDEVLSRLDVRSRGEEKWLTERGAFCHHLEHHLHSH